MIKQKMFQIEQGIKNEPWKEFLVFPKLESSCNHLHLTINALLGIIYFLLFR